LPPSETLAQEITTICAVARLPRLGQRHRWSWRAVDLPVTQTHPSLQLPDKSKASLLHNRQYRSGLNGSTRRDPGRRRHPLCRLRRERIRQRRERRTTC